MNYVYILKSKKDGRMYTGYTKDLVSRLDQHNNAKSKSTSWRRPFELIFYEAFISTEDAKNRERWLKTGWGRNHVKKILSNYLKI